MDDHPINKLDFLLGNWDLEYQIPESIFSKAATDKGTGSFKKILSNQYVVFEYSTQTGGAAKGIFAWDDKAKIYRYWWFENSGNFDSATCSFINENILAMNWHGSVLTQTFTRISDKKVSLKMQYPSPKGDLVQVMEVILTRNH